MNSIWKTGRTSLGLGWAEVVFGAWLIISPFVLGLSHKSAITNNIVTGIVLILLTFASRANGLLRLFIVFSAAGCTPQHSRWMLPALAEWRIW